MKSAAASLLMSRARRYATSVIAGTGRTIGSRIFSKTRIVAWCSASDVLSEANRNPESRRTVITNSWSTLGVYRFPRAGFRRHAQLYYLARLSSDQPSKATTWQQERADPQLLMGRGLQLFQTGSLEVVEATGDDLPPAGLRSPRFFLSRSWR